MYICSMSRSTEITDKGQTIRFATRNRPSNNTGLLPYGSNPVPWILILLYKKRLQYSENSLKLLSPGRQRQTQTPLGAAGLPRRATLSSG